MNPLQSRRFWTLILDIVCSVSLYFGGKYAGASLEDIKFLIVTLQPIAIFLIGAYTHDDIQQAKIKAG